MSAEQVRTDLMDHGVGYETHTHPLAYTTNEAAEAGHVSGKEMAKPVMLIADDRLVMAVIPGDNDGRSTENRAGLGHREGPSRRGGRVRGIVHGLRTGSGASLWGAV